MIRLLNGNRNNYFIKRLTLILSIVFMMTLTLFSCKEEEKEELKNWTCECTYNGVPQSSIIQYATIADATIADATTACEAGSVMGVTCKIK